VDIRQIERGDARAAALLHIEGQPGTFLTSLGVEFLTAFYAQLADSAHGYAFVATDGERVLGIIAGTRDTHALYRELLLKRGVHLAWPVARRLLKAPSLLGRVIKSLFYPSKVHATPEDAEFLFIGVATEARRHGIGSRMFEVLVAESQRRGAKRLLSTVEATNNLSNAFHAKWGFDKIATIELFGRLMNVYALPLVPSQAPS